MYLDGGIKRLRLVGRRTPMNMLPVEIPPPSATENALSLPYLAICPSKPVVTVPVLPLTRAGFAPFGATIEAFADARSWPPSIQSKIVNFESATKYNHVAKLRALPTPAPTIDLPAPNMCVFSCTPWPELPGGARKWALKGLERHPFSSQSFIPLASQNVGGESCYLVVVGHDGKFVYKRIWVYRKLKVFSCLPLFVHNSIT